MVFVFFLHLALAAIRKRSEQDIATGLITIGRWAIYHLHFRDRSKHLTMTPCASTEWLLHDLVKGSGSVLDHCHLWIYMDRYMRVKICTYRIQEKTGRWRTRHSSFCSGCSGMFASVPWLCTGVRFLRWANGSRKLQFLLANAGFYLIQSWISNKFHPTKLGFGFDPLISIHSWVSWLGLFVTLAWEKKVTCWV